MEKRFGKNDQIILGILIPLIIGACILFYIWRQPEGILAEITIGGEFYGCYDLTKDQTVNIVVSDHNANILQIKDSSADMIDADCPDRLCVHQKAISRKGETIVCLPNKVVVEIIQGEKSEFDSIAK